MIAYARSTPRRAWVRLCAGLVAGLFAAGTAVAQFTIDWWTIDGGGETLVGGTYELRGSLGQPDAGATLIGGEFSLTGGFWGAFAVQVAGAPVLFIEQHSPTQVRIWWEPDDPGWVLQQSSDLPAPVSWSNSPSGSTNPVVVPTGPVRFYRVHHP